MTPLRRLRAILDELHVLAAARRRFGLLPADDAGRARRLISEFTAIHGHDQVQLSDEAPAINALCVGELEHLHREFFTTTKGG